MYDHRVIKTFDPNDRYADLGDIVSSHSVPMVRSWALILFYADSKGAKTSVASGIRTDAVIEEHNRRFGTNLHGQQWLVNAHARDPAHFAAANSPTTTSHCWFSDGNPVYRTAAGVHIPAGGQLPRYGHGMDVDDLGKIENNSHLLVVTSAAGIHLVVPYHVGSELHHLVLVTDPLMALVDLGLHVRTLDRGIHPGKDVEHLQRMLKRLDYLGKEHDVGSKYGQQTQTAAVKFKKDHNLGDDKIFGEKAWRAIEHANARKVKS